MTATARQTSPGSLHTGAQQTPHGSVIGAPASWAACGRVAWRVGTAAGRARPRPLRQCRPAGRRAGRRLGDEFGEAVALQGVERVLLQQGRYEEALPFARKALRLVGRHRSAATIGAFENALGEVCALLGRYDEALRRSRRALAMREHGGSRRDAAQTLHTLGMVYSRFGDHGHAVAHYQQALTIYRELGELPLQVSSLTGLSDAQFAAGDDTAAQQSQRQAQAILDSLPPQAAQQVKAWLSRSSVCC
jgi:tetratricopeptide (TPR) repeat protein